MTEVAKDLQTAELAFHTQQEYYAALARDIARCGSGDRVLIASMGFDPAEPAVADLLSRSLIPAAREGADVALAIDAYAFMFDERFRPAGPLIGSTGLHSGTPYFQRKLESLAQLSEVGITCGVTHLPRRVLHLPIAGRSHIKSAVVNDSFYLGGSGLDHTTTPDAMVSGQNRAAADYLAGIITGLAGGNHMRALFGDRDQIFHIDEDTDICVDVGKPGQSCVMDRALHIIDDAEESLLLTCQYLPGGVTGRHLSRAITERGVNVLAVYNNRRNRRLGGSVMNVLSLRERLALARTPFAHELPPESPFIHAKILASEKEGMIGSHNYVSQGVRLGTAEITLHQRSPLFIGQARQVFDRMLA